MEVYSWENHGTKMGDFPVSHLYNIGGIQGVSVSIHIYPYLVTRNDAEEGGSSAKTAASFWFGNSTFWLPSPNINLTWNQQMAEHHVRSPINWGFRVQKIGGSGWCRHVAWICWATAGRRNWCVPIGKRCVLGRAIAACWEHQFWESRNPDPIISGIRMPNIFFSKRPWPGLRMWISNSYFQDGIGPLGRCQPVGIGWIQARMEADARMLISRFGHAAGVWQDLWMLWAFGRHDLESLEKTNDQYSTHISI